MHHANRGHALFPEAVHALGAGDVTTLRELLGQAPELVLARGSVPPRGTLLHYGSFNGFDEVSHTAPPTAPEMARMLIERGADAQALVDDKSWGTAMCWALSSWFTFAGGVQNALVDAYLAGGAAIEGVAGDGAPLGHAIGFGYTSAVEHLASSGAHVHHLMAAAALGDLERLSGWHRNGRFAAEALAYAQGLRRETGRFSWPPARDVDGGTQALITAATHGRKEVVAWLLHIGVDPNASVSLGQTALHFAAYAGHPEVVTLLLEAGARVDAHEAQFDRTPWEWALETGEQAIADQIRDQAR